jgi:hypothetical protein
VLLRVVDTGNFKEFTEKSFSSKIRQERRSSGEEAAGGT